MADESKGSTSVAEKPRVPLKGKFTVELGDSKGSNFILRTLSSRKLRGRFNRADMHNGSNPAPIEGKMSRLPDIPGTHLDVDLGKKTVVIRDPLGEEKNQGVVNSVNRVMRAANLREDKRTVEPQTEKFDDDGLVTFLMELHRFDSAGCLHEVSGSLPSVAAIEAAPGDELFDPGSKSQTQCKYKKDRAADIQRIENSHRS